MIARSLSEASELLARRQVSAIDLLEEALASIARADHVVGAWVTVDPEGARRAATASDERSRLGRRRSPIDGVPIGVKDLIDTCGTRTTYGSPLFERHVPGRDAHVVGRLRRAGVIILGKTVTTQFAAFDPAGTRNPWHPAHTPGGSSSGSAAAVAAGMVAAALGTQTGGSTLRPASYCGVVGHVPSPGWVGRSGIFPCSWSLDRVGLLAARVADLGPFLDACLGRDRQDPVSRPVRRRPRPPVPPRRVGLLEQLDAQASSAMRRAVLSVAGLLVRSGADVTAVRLADLAAAHAAHLTVMRAEIAAVHADLYAASADAYGPEIAALVATGRRVSATDYLRALRLRGVLRRRLVQALNGFDLLLAPAAVGEAEASLDTIGSPVMNLLATFAGLPALSLPAALGEDGLPVGVQLIGRPDDDDRLLSAAEWLEAELAFRRPALPPDIHEPPLVRPGHRPITSPTPR